jgi:hypothetical protein
MNYASDLLTILESETPRPNDIIIERAGVLVWKVICACMYVLQHACLGPRIWLPDTDNFRKLVDLTENNSKIDWTNIEAGVSSLLRGSETKEIGRKIGLRVSAIWRENTALLAKQNTSH